MTVFPLFLLLSIIILALIVMSELYAPNLIKESFENIPKTTYWASFVAPRSDIGPTQENLSFIRDPRYFNDYADVSRIGAKYDFCRMLASADDDTNLFFACALAGTDGLNSISFRTKGVKDGFKISYDDYMRDVNGDGREDYCRIVKSPDSSWQPMCVTATDTGFDGKEIVDTAPPNETEIILKFYQSCVTWLRLMSDMKDTMGNVSIQTAGGIAIDEAPRPSLASTLKFNGTNQFLRVSDSRDLSLGFLVPLRSVRVFMVWVKFDEFTNNAKIFDFGNGAGADNVFLGILGKGDPTSGSGNLIRGKVCGDETTVPLGVSGAQTVAEVSPQTLMETTSANINKYTAQGFEVLPRKLPPTLLESDTTGDSTGAQYATLIYEVWDKQARKMRIKVNGIVPLGKWVHIAIAAMNDDAFRPNIGVYINAEKVLERDSGFLPSTGRMTTCFIGKSNWANATSQYENRDELFKGSMFDFRMYQGSVPPSVIVDTFAWGQKKLNINLPFPRGTKSNFASPVAGPAAPAAKAAAKAEPAAKAPAPEPEPIVIYSSAAAKAAGPAMGPASSFSSKSF